ncbi:uncharacterized protein LOC111077521 [Drosophila obscura]|uniref:uncharacterized protein LOC111077521 n=1 Tax=Drosophila obscura TaxID=7282 RepID=UPI001BB18B63|nr:uncharacterized protein LOC111077521 [Drosophila obscura]
MRFHVLCIVWLIEMNYFDTLAARPIPRSTHSPTGLEPPQLPIDAGVKDDEPKPDLENTMGAGGMGGLTLRRSRRQLPPRMPRRILAEDSIGKPKPRGKELSIPVQINCGTPNRKRFKLIEELYCEALSLTKNQEIGVHYRIHRIPT